MSAENHEKEKGALPDGIEMKDVENSPVLDKVLGAIYGNALGDAVGLATEFLDREKVQELYGDKDIPFPDFTRNFHNSRWSMGDWTDDTDQLILIIETILEKKKVDEKLFARKLRKWIQSGFHELGDYAGMGLGATVSAVCSSVGFLEDPHKCAKEVWLRSRKRGAANGAVMRTSILGCWEYDDIDKVVQNTLDIARVTHWDPRCTASCLAITLLIAYILQGDSTKREEDIFLLCQKVQEKTLELTQFEDAEHKKLFINYLNAPNLDWMKLDDPPAIGYTLKCFACGYFALRSNASFKETIIAIVKHAGDADTNAAVAGAVLGCKIGFRQLPEDWISAMPNKKWLDKKVVKLLELMGLIGK